MLGSLCTLSLDGVPVPLYGCCRRLRVNAGGEPVLILSKRHDKKFEFFVEQGLM